MRATSIALVILAAALSGPACGADELDVYGRINVTLQDSDESDGEHSELKSNASRIGVKGEKALDAGLSVVYQLEWGVNIDGETDDDTFVPRNQFVGLRGRFGTVKVGRHDTALKQAQGDFDLFDDLEGDIARVVNGENRLKDYVGYVSPTFGKAFTVTVNFFPGEDRDGEGEDVDKTSFSLVYEKDEVYAAVAYDDDVEGQGVTTTRLVGGYTLGPARLMVLYQIADVGPVDEDGIGASLAWTLGKYVAKLQYLTSDIWQTQPQADPLDNRFDSSLSLGVDRKLGDDTRVFGFYTTGDIGGTDASDDYVALGLEHKF